MSSRWSRAAGSRRAAKATRAASSPSSPRPVRARMGSRAVDAVGDGVIAWTSSRQLFEITPKLCVKSSKSCGKLLGEVADGDDIDPSVIGPWRDGIVMASSTKLLVTDRRAKVRMRLQYDAN